MIKRAFCVWVTEEGWSLSSRGSGKRPDPIAVKIDRAKFRNEEEITQNERVAREPCYGCLRLASGFV